MSCRRTSLNSFRRHVRTVLAQNQAAGKARAVGFKRDLSIDNLVEDLLFAFGINLEFRLPRGLCEELIAFPCVVPLLVQGEGRRASVGISLKGDVCINDLQEEVSLALRKTWALGCPVAWVKSWSPSRVTVRMNFGASWYRPT